MNVSFPGLGIDLEIQRSFEIFGFTIYWYGVIIALGLILAIVYASYNSKRLGVNPDKLLNCVIVGVVTGIIGARAYYVLFNLDYYASHTNKILAINEGGLAIYGGIIGALIGGLIVAKICKMNIPAVLDVASIGFLIGQGIGRWGNFFNQEAFGTATTLPWGMVSEGTNNVIVHPCFLYESLWCLLGVLLLHLFSRSKFRKYSGQMALLYLVWYGAERAIVEGLRTDSLLIPNTSLRVSQLLSILICVIGITLLVILYVRKYENIVIYTAPVAETKSESTPEETQTEYEEITSSSASSEQESENNNDKKEKKKFVVNVAPENLDLSEDEKKADNKEDNSKGNEAKQKYSEEFFDINDLADTEKNNTNQADIEIDNILNDIKKYNE
ncbi:MAG: prolipoprotein diacylglyceryl transferase [Acutalibacteraceae bacterium]|nr:prolipoprotein diacylglyceryl transferase [Acutalibacteraceae bacterium]